MAICEMWYRIHRLYSEGLGGEPAYGPDEFSQVKIDSFVNAVTSINDSENMKVPHPEELHDKWMEYHKKNGWVYGEKNSVDKKTHPSMKPYSELPRVETIKDDIFLELMMGCKNLIGDD